MVSQYIWIGIVVGVFFIGIAGGYAIFSNAYQPDVMENQFQIIQQLMMQSPQHRQFMIDQIIQNPEMRAQWMATMMQDPQQMQQMQQLMLDPEFREQMFQQMNTMMDDPQLQQQMFQQMGIMMNDPQLRQQMTNNMMQNQQFMQEMMTNPDFQQQWMGPGMIRGGMMMGPGMMQGSSVSQPLPTGEPTQTRTFEIFLDEIKIFAETENESGEEETVEVEIHQWNPNSIVVNKGDTVVLKISNPRGTIHSFAIPQFGVSTGNLEPRGGTETIEFVADKAGVFTFICNTPYVPEQNWCSTDHASMTGTIIVLE